MGIGSGNLVVDRGRVSGTLEVRTPESGQVIGVRMDGVPARALRRWSRQIRARYDAAAVTTDNERHWTNADNLSASAANSPAVRATLRRRARYETANNSYLKGIVQTLANHTIGTGPRLRLRDISRASAKFIQREFAAWADEVQLARKLRTLRGEKVVNGEGFAIVGSNLLLEAEVKLDIRTVEADCVADPTGVSDPRNVDGVMLDVYGNPAEYRVLKYHPGDMIITTPLMGRGSYDTIPVGRMCHWFAMDRSGQYRGVPDITSALPLFADLRRFTLAVVAAAEVAADFAGVLYTDAMPPGADEEEGAAFTVADVEKRMLMTLPAGYKMSQYKAEQPVSTYAEFVKAIIREAARCVHMPYCIAAGDSGDASFSASQNDQRVYVRSIEIDQDDCETIVLAKIWRRWFAEARRIEGYLPPDVAGMGTPAWGWHWDSISLSDPGKLAGSRQTSVVGGFGNIARYYAEDGLDCEEEQTAQAEALGLTLEEYRRTLAVKLFGAIQAKPGSDEDGDAGDQGDQGDPPVAAEAAPQPLNGAQIASAVDVLVKLREQTLSTIAAVEMLVGIGVDRTRAEAVAASIPQGMDTKGGDVSFKREVLGKLLANPGARDAVYNAVDIEDLVQQTGLTPEAGYEAPYLPVVAPAGQLVSGETIKDKYGDVVGADVLPAEESPVAAPANAAGVDQVKQRANQKPAKADPGATK